MIRFATASLAGSLFALVLPSGGAGAASPSVEAAPPGQLLAQAAAPAGETSPPASVAAGPGNSTSVPPAPPVAAPGAGPTPPAAAPAANPPPPAAAAAPALNGPAPLGAVRNNSGSSVATPTGIDPQYYGGTLSSPGRPQGGLQPAYGGTQRNNGLSDADNAHPLGGMSPYGGTQSTLGTPQFSGGTIYGRPQGTASTAPSRSLTGTTLPGNPNNYGQAPLGSRPITRDQVSNFGGTAGYTASGVYTGTAGQSIGYGQPYALSGRPVGGTASSLPDATAPLRPYVPLNTGRSGGPTNSGYGIPNGSRATTMDARGIQRGN